MTNNLPVPADTATDARNRAWRTFVQSLLVDIAAAVILAVTPLLSDVHWNRAYWLAVAALAARSAVTAAVSWVARRVLPPATS